MKMFLVEFIQKCNITPRYSDQTMVIMTSKILILILAYFVCFSTAITTIQHETFLGNPEDWTTQQNTEDPLITNLTDIIQSGVLFADKEIWCCKSGTTYLPGLDRCVPNFVSTLYNESFPDYSFPNDGLNDCPDGYVSHSTKDFHLKNGTLLLDDGERLKSNEFCINRVDEENYSASNGSFVARYCVPDPCSRKGRLGCIRKCCPSDMAIVTKDYHDKENINICESYPNPLNLSLIRNPQNETIDQGSFFTRGGLGIKCGNLPQDLFDISSFSIDHDGQILFYSEDHPNGEKSDDYCIDNLVGDGTIDMVALGCFPEQGEDSKGALLFGCLKLIATTFLIATLAVYCLLPKMRNIHGVTVMCLLASMTIQNIFHAICLLVRGDDMPTGLCSTLAISLHFAYIATFTWLNVLCFDVWRMFSSITSPTNSSVLGKKFFYYSVYGWGIPFIIVVVGQILQHSDVPDYIIKPGLASKLYCWFNHKYRGPLIAYLYGPMVTMIVANIVMFVWASLNFYRSSVESSQVTNVSRKSQRFKVILSLFLLMGIPWTTEFITFMADTSFESALFTDILNIFLPLFIFVIFICKRTVWKMLKLKFPRMSPFFSNCEKLGSRIVSKKNQCRPPVADEESNSNNTNGSGSTNNTVYHSQTESPGQK